MLLICLLVKAIRTIREMITKTISAQRWQPGAFILQALPNIKIVSCCRVYTQNIQQSRTPKTGFLIMRPISYTPLSGRLVHKILHHVFLLYAYCFDHIVNIICILSVDTFENKFTIRQLC